MSGPSQCKNCIRKTNRLCSLKFQYIYQTECICLQCIVRITCVKLCKPKIELEKQLFFVDCIVEREN